MDNRDPLDIDYLRTQLIANGPYQRIEYFPEVSSTNTELVAAAHDGAPAWTAFLTDHQTAGRGRMGRSFSAPPRSQMPLSILIRPPTNPSPASAPCRSPPVSHSSTPSPPPKSN